MNYNSDEYEFEITIINLYGETIKPPNGGSWEFMSTHIFEERNHYGSENRLLVLWVRKKQVAAYR